MSAVDPLLDQVRAAFVDGATAEARELAAGVCRQLLAVLDAKPGAPMQAPPPAPTSSAPDPVGAFLASLGASLGPPPAAAPSSAAADPLGALLDNVIARYRDHLPPEDLARVRAASFHVPTVNAPPWR